MEPFFAERIETFLRHNTDTEFHRIKHHGRCIRKQGTIVRKCYKSADRQLISVIHNYIADRDFIVVCIHPVDGNLILRFRKRAFHQADTVDLRTVFVKTKLTLKIIGFTLYVKVLVDLYAFFFNRLNRFLGSLGNILKITILDVVFFESCIIHNLDAFCSHKESGNKSDNRYHEDKQNNVFCQISF